MERLRKIALKNKYEVLTLVLRGDVEILHKKYLNRMQNENRHPVHLSTTLDIFDDFSYQTDKDILAKINEFLGVCKIV